MSQGKIRGMAPFCNIIAIKILDDLGNGKIEWLIRGVEYILDNKERYNIRIVNISIGSFSKKGMEEESQLVKTVDRLWDAGLVVCVAAGNEGNLPSTITTPGISRKVITVGTSDDYKTVRLAGSSMVNYSGRGPTKNCIVKPDLVCPGYNILSCNNISRRNKTPYTAKSGTSMSTPQIVGAIALLIQREPNLTNREVKIKLRESCDDLKLPRNQQGWGIFNLVKFLS